MKAEEFDKKFDDGEEDILRHFDVSTARRLNHTPKRVNVDFPQWVVDSLDREAERVGVSRQALIKMWTVERIEAAVH